MIRALLLSVFLSASVVLRTAAGDVSPLDRAIELYEAKDYDAAIELFEQAAEDGPDTERAVYLAGRAHFDKEEFREASRWFDRAREIDPENAEYHSWLGRAYGMWALESSVFRKMSLAGDVRSCFEKAVELAPDNVRMRNDLLSYYLEAPALVGGSTTKAMEQAQAIARLDPLRGQFALARVYEDRKDFDEAEAAYRKAIELAPESTAAYLRLAYLLQRREAYDLARDVLAGLVEKKPDDLGARYQLGRNGALSGRALDEAAAALEYYIEHDGPDFGGPPLASAYTRLGQVQEHRGDSEAARAAYRKALRLDPDYKEAKQGLKRVD